MQKDLGITSLVRRPTVGKRPLLYYPVQTRPTHLRDLSLDQITQQEIFQFNEDMISNSFSVLTTVEDGEKYDRPMGQCMYLSMLSDVCLVSKFTTTFSI